MSLGHLHLIGAAFRRHPLAVKAPSTFTKQSQNTGNAGFTKSFTTKRREAHFEGGELSLSSDYKGRNFVTVPIQFSRGKRSPATVHASKRALFFLEAGNPKHQPDTPFRPLFLSKVLGKSRKPTAETIMSVSIRCYPVDAKNVLQHDDDETAAGTVCTFQIPYGKLKGVFMPPEELTLPESLSFGEDGIEVDTSDFRPRHMFYADLISLDELVPDLDKYGIEPGTMAFIGNRNVVRFHHDGGVMVDFHRNANTIDAILAAAAEESILPPDVNHGKTVKRTKGKGGKTTTVVTQRCGYSVHRRVDGKPTYDTHADFPAALEAARAGWPSAEAIAAKRAAAKAKRDAARAATKPATKPVVDPASGFTTVPKRKGGKSKTSVVPKESGQPAVNAFAALAVSDSSTTESETDSETDDNEEHNPAMLTKAESPVESPDVGQSDEAKTPGNAESAQVATIASLLASLSDPTQIQAILAGLQASPEPVQASPEPVQASPEPVQASPEPAQASEFPSIADAAKRGTPSRGVSKPMPPRKSGKAKSVRMTLQDFAAMGTASVVDDSASEDETEDETASDLSEDDEEPVQVSNQANKTSWAARAAAGFPQLIAPGTAPKSPDQAAADRAKDKQSRESKAGRKAKEARNKKREENKAAKAKAARVAKEQRSSSKPNHRASSVEADAVKVIAVASSSPQPAKPLSPGKAARKERREAARNKDSRAAAQADAEAANQAKREVAQKRKASKSAGKAKPKHEKTRH